MAQDVLCEVNNCTFWSEGNKCDASSIFVVSNVADTAATSDDTGCKTFEAKV